MRVSLLEGCQSVLLNLFFLGFRCNFHGLMEQVTHIEINRSFISGRLCLLQTILLKKQDHLHALIVNFVPVLPLHRFQLIFRIDFANLLEIFKVWMQNKRGEKFL